MEEIWVLRNRRIKINHILKRLISSIFVRNLFIVMSGTASGQIIGFFLSPIISRFYSPSDFGIFGSFNAVVSVIGAGITLDYSQAIMLPKEKEDAFYIFIISCMNSLFIGLLIAIMCLIIPEKIRNLIKIREYWIFIILTLVIIIFGISQSLQAWCVRYKAFNKTSISQIVRSISSNTSQIGLGYLKSGYRGLIISSFLADILSGIVLIKKIIPDAILYGRNINLRRIKELFLEYKDFPMYSASQNVINALSNGLPVLLLANFYGIAVAGAYAFGMRLLHTPMGIISSSLRQVLFQKASEIHNQGESLFPIYWKSTFGLFAIIFFPGIILFIWAPEIFSFIFGMQWNLAGQLAKWLILWMMFAFCNLPAILFSRIIRIQRKVFFYDLALLFFRTMTLILGGLYLTALNTIILFSFVGAIMNLFLIIIVGKAVIRKEYVYKKNKNMKINYPKY